MIIEPTNVNLLEFMLQNIMMLFVLLSVFGIATAIMFLVMPYFAAPTYAGMVFLELFMSFHNENVPEFFRFKQPSDGTARYWMDLFATITTIIGVPYALILNNYAIHHQEIKFLELYISNQLVNPALPCIFCFCLLILYFINSRNNQDNRHPMTKLKELCKLPSVPSFLHK